MSETAPGRARAEDGEYRVRRRGRRSGRQTRASQRLGCGLVVAGMVVLVLWGAMTARQVLDRARSLEGHLEQVLALSGGQQGSPGLDALGSAGSHLTAAREDLEAIQASLGFLLPAGRLLAWVPGYGGDLAAASDLLAVAVGVASAGDRAYQAVWPALAAVEGSSGGNGAPLEQEARILEAVRSGRGELRSAQRDLQAAMAARQRIDGGRLSPRVADLLARLDKYTPWLETALDAALVAPSLLGGDGPRTYLIIAQNNHELRATGGFISGVGELRLEKGRIVSLGFDDSYAVDNLEVAHELTPPNFQWTLYGDLWFFRDANWDPDFPTSARRAMEIYERDRGVQADGVIALDLEGLRLLLEAVGPIAVEGIEETVTGANVNQVLQEQWARPGKGDPRDWWLHRKDFMGQIAAASLDRVASGQGLQPLRLLEAASTVLAEKHILIYVSDAQTASLLRERNWDGALVTPSLGSDLLMVVDSNVGFNKTDASVERSIQYRVDLGAAGRPQAELAVTYHNRGARPVETCIQQSRYGDGYADMMDRCYWDYVRVYVPYGSRLLDGPELPWPAGSLAARDGGQWPRAPFSATMIEGELTVWAGFFALRPGDSRTLTYRYELPSWVQVPAPGGTVRYQVHVVKQASTGAVPLQVEVMLPDGAEVIDAPPNGQLAIETDLRTDWMLTVTYRKGTGSQ